MESGFGTFIADLQANKCEIGMFGVGATLKRAQAVEFSKPYLVTNIYAVTRKDGKIKTWDDIDQKGVKAAVSLGSYIEPFMKSYLKNAEVVSVAPPNTREAELVAQRVDVIMTDFPTAIKVTDEFDWARHRARRRSWRSRPTPMSCRRATRSGSTTSTCSSTPSSSTAG